MNFGFTQEQDLSAPKIEISYTPPPPAARARANNYVPEGRSI